MHMPYYTLQAVVDSLNGSRVGHHLASLLVKVVLGLLILDNVRLMSPEEFAKGLIDIFLKNWVHLLVHTLIFGVITSILVAMATELLGSGVGRLVFSLLSLVDAVVFVCGYCPVLYLMLHWVLRCFPD
jgi:hypothetical protein